MIKILLILKQNGGLWAQENIIWSLKSSWRCFRKVILNNS